MMDIIIDIESTGLCASTSQLTAIGLLTDKGFNEIFFVKNPKEEVTTIENFIEKIRKLIDAENGDVKIITYYGSRFDIPYVFSRGLKLKAKGIFDIPELFSKHIDVYDIVKGFLKLDKNSLPDVCKFLGIPKMEYKIDGRDMPNIYLQAISGDEQKKELIIAHLKDDLNTLLALWKILKPLTGLK